MSTNVLRGFGSWAALAAGSIEVLGMIFLILFFAVELPQGITSTLRFGFLSDLLPILAAPFVLAVMIVLSVDQHKTAPQLSVIAALLGIAGTLVVAGTNILFISEEITLEEQIQLFYVSIALLGFWHILVNYLARRDGFLPPRLTTFGLLVGVGQVMMFVVSLFLGGDDDMIWLSPRVIVNNIPLLISLAISGPMALVGYLGAPVWLLWLGRTHVINDTTMPSVHTLEERN